MLHQQSVLSLLGVLSKLSDKNQLTMQKDLVDEVIIEAINKFPALGQGAVQFTKNFYPTPLYAWTNKNLLIETLNHVFFSFLQTSGNNLINVMTSLAFEGYPERFNAESEPGWYVQIKIANAGGAENLQARDSKYLGGTAFIIVNDIVQRHGGWLRTNSDGELEKNASIYLPERELTRQF